MGGQESLIANLNDPDEVRATVMIYGVGFDKSESKRLEKLKSSVLVITGGEDAGATQAAINFLASMREAKRPYEMLIYPGRTTVTPSHSLMAGRTTMRRQPVPPGSWLTIFLAAI